MRICAKERRFWVNILVRTDFVAERMKRLPRCMRSASVVFWGTIIRSVVKTDGQESLSEKIRVGRRICLNTHWRQE